jgi:hypothetical protein
LASSEGALSPSVDPATAVESGCGAVAELVPVFKSPFVVAGVHEPDMTDVPNEDVAEGVVAPGVGTGEIVLVPVVPLKPVMEAGAPPATSVGGHAAMDHAKGVTKLAAGRNRLRALFDGLTVSSKRETELLPDRDHGVGQLFD